MNISIFSPLQWLGYLLSPFTGAKSFRNNPVIGSRILNYCGLHIVRLLFAHTIFRFRQWLLHYMVGPKDKQEYKKNGYLLKQDFLPEAQFQRLLKEVNDYHGITRECIQGDTLTHRIFLDEEALSCLPECRGLITNRYFLRLLKWCGGKNQYPFFYIQRIYNQYHEGKYDPQKVMHADAFQPSIKCWYFLHDVKEDAGPFTYAPGSHRLTWKRLCWEYKRSCEARSIEDGYSEKGSFRINDEELTTLDYGSRTAITVKANTLVIANTYGFHCRGFAKEKCVRLAIWAYLRPTPFNPLPGVDFQWLRRLRYDLVNKYYQYKDRKASEKGGISTWHLLNKN